MTNEQVTTKTAHSMIEFDRIVKELIDTGFENLGAWEFYNAKLNIRVILKLKVNF